MKTLRTRRYEKLKQSGFLDGEAFVLSRISQSVPYIREMMADRRYTLRQAEKEGLNKTDYIKTIKKLYDDRGWSEYAIINNKRMIKLDPRAIYKMLREYEELWKNEHDDAFRSPWVKKQKKHRNFEKLFERNFNQFHD